MIKHAILLMSLFFCVRLGATDLLVNNTGAPNTYATLAAAINAANDGDRILLEPNIPIFESVSIDKSLEIVSTAVDTAFTIIGTVTIIANANKEIKLVGAEVHALSFNSGTADSSSLCKFYFIDSKLILAAGIDSRNRYVETNVLFCDQLDRRVEFDYGKIIASDIKGFISNVNGKIIANKIITLESSRLNGSYLVANNNFYHSTSAAQTSNSQHQLIIDGSINSTNTNYIINNSFYSNRTNTQSTNIGLNANIYVNTSANSSEISILNNSFWLRNIALPNYNITHDNHLSLNVLYNNFGNYHLGHYGVSGNNNFMNHSLYFNNYSSSPSSSDAGHPGIRYFDIDMTRNDIGLYGGPYSWYNYWGSSTGKGVIYDLDMPFEYWTGQSATINAKAAHQN